MSYGRFNYVAQPEDKVKQLIPVIAPYDNFAISWATRASPAPSPLTRRRTTLEKWAARQLDEPLLRFAARTARPWSIRR